jgi:hypothetical protein
MLVVAVAAELSVAPPVQVAMVAVEPVLAPAETVPQDKLTLEAVEVEVDRILPHQPAAMVVVD